MGELTVTAGDGVRLYAEAHGEGTPVLFSPGYCQTHENFRPQVAPLVEAGRRVVLWDYRGHGRSEAPADPDAYTMERVVDDLGRVLDAAAPGRRAVLGGLSFGGLASLHVTRARPERVAALLLLASGPGFKKREAQDPRGVALFGRRVAGPAPGVIDRLGEIEAPALVMVGALDGAYLRAAEVMAAKLPRAKHVVVPDAGHVLNIEQAEAVNRQIQAFLDEALGAGG
ncbi:MAG: alpha/beta fold hydrolase [Myxococcota bacterium]|nr:alpha/beta fold hydrolase [Myxococcota bacterium]